MVLLASTWRNMWGYMLGTRLCKWKYKTPFKFLTSLKLNFSSREYIKYSTRPSVIRNLSITYLEFNINWSFDLAGLIMVGKDIGQVTLLTWVKSSACLLCVFPTLSDPGPGCTYQGKNFHSRLDWKAQVFPKLYNIISYTPWGTDKYWNKALGRIWKECRSSHLVTGIGTELGFICKDNAGWHWRKNLVNRYSSIEQVAQITLPLYSTRTILIKSINILKDIVIHNLYK